MQSPSHSTNRRLARARASWSRPHFLRGDGGASLIGPEMRLALLALSMNVANGYLYGPPSVAARCPTPVAAIRGTGIESRLGNAVEALIMRVHQGPARWKARLHAVWAQPEVVLFDVPEAAASDSAPSPPASPQPLYETSYEPSPTRYPARARQGSYQPSDRTDYSPSSQPLEPDATWQPKAGSMVDAYRKATRGEEYGI